MYLPCSRLAPLALARTLRQIQRIVRDEDGDVAAAPQDARGAAVRTGTEALDGDTLIGDGVDNPELIWVEAVVILSVRRGRSDDLVDVARRHIGQELENRQRLADAPALDGIRHTPHFAGRMAHVLGDSTCLHALPPLADGCGALAATARVTAEVARRRELTQFMADHVFGDV